MLKIKFHGVFFFMKTHFLVNMIKKQTQLFTFYEV